MEYCSVCQPDNPPESGSGKRVICGACYEGVRKIIDVMREASGSHSTPNSSQTLEDVFHWISHNGSPMPAHRALPVKESSIDKQMIESQAAQHDHNMPESARPETQPARPAPSNGLFHLDYWQLEPQLNMPSISTFPLEDCWESDISIYYAHS